MAPPKLKKGAAPAAAAIAAADPTPFAIAFFYKPSRESAIAAGVPLPVSGLTLPISRAEGVALGIMLPISPYHIDPTDPSGSSTSSAAAAPNTRSGPVALPSYMYPATKSINPKHFEGADAFVRFEEYKPGEFKLPDPVPGKSYSAILYPAGQFEPGQSLKVLPTVHVFRTSELRSVLKREGPLKVIIHEVESVAQAPAVLRMVREKSRHGWEASPDTTVLSTLSFISEKASELVTDLLPKLKEEPQNRNVGRTCNRRLKLIKKHCRRVRKKVVGDVIPKELCRDISQAITEVHGKKPEEDPSYLEEVVPSFIKKMKAAIAKSISFTDTE